MTEEKNLWVEHMFLICLHGPTRKNVLPSKQMFPKVYNLAKVRGVANRKMDSIIQPTPKSKHTTNPINRFEYDIENWLLTSSMKVGWGLDWKIFLTLSKFTSELLLNYILSETFACLVVLFSLWDRGDNSRTCVLLKDFFPLSFTYLLSLVHYTQHWYCRVDYYLYWWLWYKWLQQCGMGQVIFHLHKSV